MIDGTAGRKYPLGLAALAVTIVLACFALFAEHPPLVEGDIAFPAYSALQYVHHEVGAFDAVRLVDARDLAKDIDTNLIAWSPSWTFAFVAMFKAGLTPGAAARALEIFFSISGALGWVWIVALLGLRRFWAVLAVVIASMYCLREPIGRIVDIGDPMVYAVAPWLIGAALMLSRHEGRTGEGGIDKGWVMRATALCFALGCVYWIKYSAVFFGAAVVGALLLEHCRRNFRRSPGLTLALAALYGAAFGVPLLAEKAYNVSRTGHDLIEQSQSLDIRPMQPGLYRGYIEEDLYEASSILFGAKKGAERVTRDHPPELVGSRMDYRPMHWLVRIPGLLLIVFALYLIAKTERPFIRNLTFLLLLLPIVGYPLLSITSHSRVVSALVRSSETHCIFVELVILGILSRRLLASSRAVRTAWVCLAVLTGIALVLSLGAPYAEVSEALTVFRRPRYQTGPAGLYIVNFSPGNSRSVAESITSQLHGPDDVIVLATPLRGIDTWLALEGHRLLPLTSMWATLAQTHGRDGANYNGSSPFVTSRPLRVILVACNPYRNAAYADSPAKMRSRFPQAHEWARQPAPADGKVEIWTADLKP
ncbi:MAG: hypothetical protein ABJC09_01795 [Terriglobia bacterium]